MLRCRVASSARAIRQLALLPCLSSEPAPCPLSGTLSHSLPSPSRSPARVHEHGHAMAAASTTSCALLLPLPPAKLGPGTVHGLQWPSLSPPEPPVPGRTHRPLPWLPWMPPSWSSCMSRRSYIRRRLPYGPPPAQPRPLAGAHGRLDASPPLSRRRRASSSELLCRPLCNRDRGPRVTIETSPGGFLQNRRLK